MADFSDAFDPVSDEGRRIAQSDYLQEGPLPVVDQGEALIGGYTADTAAEVKSRLPLIIFGDHTRRVKYVDFPFAVGAQGVKLLRPTEAFSSKFLFYLLPTLELPDRGYSRHYQFLRVLPFVMPPRPEQNRIVDHLETFLTEIDAAVAALKRVQANLKRYRASVLKAACEGRLVPTEAELARKAGRIYETGEQLLARILKERRAKWEADQRAKMLAAGKPPSYDGWKKKYKEPDPPDTSGLHALADGWVWASVDQLSWDVRNGLSTKPDAESGTPILRISAVRPLKVDVGDVRFLSATEQHGEFALNPGDLLFTRYNGTRDLVGVCGAVPVPGVGLLHPDKLIRVRLVTVNSGYVTAVANVGESRQFLERKIRTTAGQSGVSGADIKSTPIPLPPLDEQQRIASEIERRLSVLEATATCCTADVARADRLRQAILKRAFEGKLVPQDPNEEPASVLLERIRAERTSAKSNANPSAKKRTNAAAGVLP